MNDAGEDKTLVVRFPDGEDVTLTVANPAEFNINILRNEVRSKRGGTTQNRQLNFFYNGHVLGPTTDFARQVFGNRDRVYVHCSTGQILSPEQLERESMGLSSPSPEARNAEVRGFDRLQANGFTDEEIAFYREQFGELYGTSGTDQQALEDLWIDNGDLGSYSSLLNRMLCVLLGIFAGAFTPLICRLNIFTASQVRTIYYGFGINVIITLLRNLA